MSRRLALSLILSTALLGTGAGRAKAYDFTVCAYAMTAVYVHVHTVSAFCHDRTPVARSDKPLSVGCVSGSTAPGCLIDRVDFVGQNGQTYSWSSGIGRTGGHFVLKQYTGSSPFVCFNGDRPDC